MDVNKVTLTTEKNTVNNVFPSVNLVLTLELVILVNHSSYSLLSVDGVEEDYSVLILKKKI